MKDKVLIILRACPGAGKSTLAEILTSKENICTADDYMMEGDKYVWKVEKLHMAHTKCQEKCKNLMVAKTPLIVVANSATTKKEIQPYMDLATGYGYMTFSLIIENRHNGKNVHNVPDEKVKIMAERFDIKLI